MFLHKWKRRLQEAKKQGPGLKPKSSTFSCPSQQNIFPYTLPTNFTQLHIKFIMKTIKNSIKIQIFKSVSSCYYNTFNFKQLNNGIRCFYKMEILPRNLSFSGRVRADET